MTTTCTVTNHQDETDVAASGAAKTFVYAGIDEAGYGPMFGPLVVGRAVFAVGAGAGGEEGAGFNGLAGPDGSRSYGPDHLPPLWELLSGAVCRSLTGRRGRIAVNDSKKLHTAASGIKHLEAGVLAFSGLAGHKPASLDEWLACLAGEPQAEPQKVSRLPWYQGGQGGGGCSDWPRCHTEGELAVAGNQLRVAVREAGVGLADLGVCVVYEDEFNRMLTATRSKAAVNFTFVARHLTAIWERFGHQAPTVIVDRQSGRTHYRELLQMTFPRAQLKILTEEAQSSAYELAQPGCGQSMTVRFEVESDANHMPAALASMACKYTRELLMERFNNWFTARLPAVKPTAGYALDAKRFWKEIRPHLSTLGVTEEKLRRMS